MNHKVAIIESVYDITSPNIPISLHRWGRLVWLDNIGVGLSGHLFFVEDGKYKRTNLSCISNVIETKDSLYIYTQNSIYKLQFTYVQPQLAPASVAITAADTNITGVKSTDN